MCGELRQGETQFGKTADALIGINEFEQAFPEKDAAGEQPDPKDGAGSENGWIEQPRGDFFHCDDFEAKQRRRSRGGKSFTSGRRGA